MLEIESFETLTITRSNLAEVCNAIAESSSVREVKFWILQHIPDDFFIEHVRSMLSRNTDIRVLKITGCRSLPTPVNTLKRILPPGVALEKIFFSLSGVTLTHRHGYLALAEWPSSVGIVELSSLFIGVTKFLALLEAIAGRSESSPVYKLSNCIIPPPNELLVEQIVRLTHALNSGHVAELSFGQFLQAPPNTTPLYPGLMSALQGNESVRALGFFSVGLSDDIAGPMEAMLQSNRGLNELTIQHCRIGNDTCDAIARSIRRHPCLRKLDVTHNQITQVVELSQSLGQNNMMTFLELDSNEIGDAGAEALASALIANSTSSLTYLGLHNCGVGDSGAIQLGRMLLHMSSLKHVNLKQNNISANGFQALVASFTGDDLTEDDIAGGLCANTSIESLKVSDEVVQRKLNFYCNLNKANRHDFLAIDDMNDEDWIRAIERFYEVGDDGDSGGVSAVYYALLAKPNLVFQR